MDYGDRLKHAMKVADVSTADLARHLGVSYQAVRKVLMGGQFGTENNAAAAKRLGVRSDWLASGLGPMVDPAALTPDVEEVARAINALPAKQRDWVLMTTRTAVELATETLGLGKKPIPQAGSEDSDTAIRELPSSSVRRRAGK